MHNNHTDSRASKELDALGPKRLMELVNDWVSPFPPPTIAKYRLPDGRLATVVRDDRLQHGTKARAGSALLHQPEFAKFSTLVYVLPRAGWAGLSLAAIGKLYGKKIVLFCPAAATASRHQLAAWEAGAELRWIRVAAMPNLNALAKQFADERGYGFVPFGLSHPAAVAGIAKEAGAIGINPKEVWCACSTGVLTRGLQVAWPRAEHHALAVSRNVHAGEKGRATMHSHPKPFLQNVDANELPPYPSALNYDAKLWSVVANHQSTVNPVLWNVAGEVDWELPAQTFVSARGWGDLTDYRS